MGCVQSYFKRAHTAGLSPSSTQDSNSKPPVSDEDAKPISEEKSVTEEPESNDTSYGVEATAVRTLAATTGTVAILGTTAKTNDKKTDENDDDNEAPNTSTPPIASDVIPEGNEKEEEDTIAVVHDTTSKTKDEASRNEDEEVKKTMSPLDTRPTSAVKMEHILLEEVKDNTQSTINKTDDISVVDNKPSPVDDVVKREPSDNVPSTLDTEKSKPEEGISVTNEENVIVEKDTTPEKTEVESDKDVTNEISDIEPKLIENEDAKDEEIEEDKVSELNKGNEEDNSKSISSERLKTNSMSDTTLSESYNAELENNSVKQSPSAEKAVESFDSSSTIEFVDLENRENVRQKRDVSDLSEGNQTQAVSLEPQAPPSDTLPNVLSEVEQNTIDRSETLTEITEEQLAEVKPSDKETPSAHTPVVVNEIETVTPVSDYRSESVIKSDVIMDEPKKVESGPKVDKVASDIMLPKSEELKAGEQNKSEINENKTDIGDESVDETIKAAATTIQATFRGFQSRKQLKEEREYDTQEKMKEEVCIETEPNKDNVIVTADEKLVTEYDNRTTKDEVPVDVDESQDNKLDSAATTIQATFRGFQMRKQLKEETKDVSELDLKDKQQIAKSEINENLNKNVIDVSNDIIDAIQNIDESRNDKVDGLIREDIETAEDNKINSAATSIQATFRGYQTRKQLKEGTNDDTKTDENEAISAQITEVQKEIQSDINQEEKHGETDDEKVNTAATTIQANFRGFQTRKQLKQETDNEPTVAAEENENVTESIKQEETGNISDAVDEKITSAATTIQATFRGFQTRKQLKEESEDNREGVDSLTETATAKMDSTVAVEEETKAKTVQLEAAEVDDIANSAATAIQATFRGFQTRKHIKEEEESQVKASEEKEKEEIQAIAPEKDNVSETVESKTDFTEKASKDKVSIEEQNEIETDQTVSAATTIQATFRGYQTRKQLKDGKEGETFNNAEIISEPTEDGKEEKETKDITISGETKETIIQAVDEIIDSAATTIQAAFRGFQVRQHLAAESDVPIDHAVTSNGDNASNVTEDLAATKIQATFRGYQARQQLKNENDENLDNKLEQSPLEHSPSELSKASEDDSEQLKRQSEGDKDSLSEEIRQSLSKLEDTIQREENKLNMVNERLPEQIGESSDEGYEQPDASGDGSFDRGTRTPTALTPEQIDIVKEEVDEICKQAVATTESILAVKSGLGETEEKDNSVSKEETEDKNIHAETPGDAKHDNREVISVDSSEDATQKELKRPETLVVIEDADEKLVCAATTIQATFRGYQTRQRLAETEQSEQPDVGASAASDDDVWDVLKNEMSEAATVIQSNYRGYRARKQLQREDAVQVLTSSSSVATNGVSSIDRDMEASTRNSGELHDIIALTPPNIEHTSSIAAEGGTGDLTASTAPAQISTPPSDEMVKRRTEADQHQHQSAAKRTHRGTADDQVLKDANIAAAKIQAGFRGYKVRKQLRNMDTGGSVNGPKRSGANNRLEARQPQSPTMSIEDRSAAKIQAGVRGFLVRKRQQAAKDAATKIQAGFRGFKARRQVQEMKTDK